MYNGCHKDQTGGNSSQSTPKPQAETQASAKPAKDTTQVKKPGK